MAIRAFGRTDAPLEGLLSDKKLSLAIREGEALATGEAIEGMMDGTVLLLRRSLQSSYADAI